MDQSMTPPAAPMARTKATAQMVLERFALVAAIRDVMSSSIYVL